MYGKILAAVNEHLHCEVAARYALEMARASGAKLYLCYAAERSTDKADLERAEAALSRLFEEAALAGIPAESISEVGRPLEVISSIIKSEGIDLVVGSVRRAEVKRPILGSVGRDMLSKLPCEVALMRIQHMGKVKPRSILVPLKDRFDKARQRADFVALLAQSFGSRVYLFHSPKPIERFFHGEIELLPLELQERMPHAISLFKQELARRHVQSEGTLRTGRAGKAVTIEAAQRRFDLVVMGATSRGLLASLLKESPMEAVLRESPCDLVIHKP